MSLDKYFKSNNKKALFFIYTKQFFITCNYQKITFNHLSNFENKGFYTYKYIVLLFIEN